MLGGLSVCIGDGGGLVESVCSGGKSLLKSDS